MSTPPQTQHQQGEGQSGTAGQSAGRQHAGQSGAGQQAHRPRTYRTGVNIPEESRHHVVGMLNRTLADTTDLMAQAKVAHWNVKGMNFYQLHLLFDEIAETLNEHVDVVAERATALGGEANGTVRSAASKSRIPEMPPDATTGPEYVAAMVERVGTHANNLRRAIYAAGEYDDEDTADMYTELSREVDEQLYFLEAHLQAVDHGAIPESPETATEGRQPVAGQQSASGQGSQAGEYRTSGGRPARYGGRGQGGPRRGHQGQQDWGARPPY